MGAFSGPFVGPQFGQRPGRIDGPIKADAVIEPTFTVPAGDAGWFSKGDRLAIDLPSNLGGGRYQVVACKPDGQGLVVVVLAVEREQNDDIT